MTAQDPLDDVGNERGLRGGELLNARAVGPLVVDAVDARVREINRDAFAVHQVAAGGSILRVGFVINEILGRIGPGLRAREVFALRAAAVVLQVIGGSDVRAGDRGKIRVAGDGNVNGAGLV